MRKTPENPKNVYQRHLRWKAANFEKNKEYQKLYQAEYRKRRREYLLEQNRERAAKYREKNGNHRANQWKKDNAARERARKKIWRKQNVAKIKAAKRARRKRTSLRIAKEATKQCWSIMNNIYEACRRITKCTGILFHVDHIRPLSKGGGHVASNLQILPAKINIRKAAKLVF